MSNHQPQRSNFDLICGMILGGLLVGVLSPIVSKNFGNEGLAGKKSLRARAPLTHDMKSVSLGKDKVSNKEKPKVIASANAEPARIAEKIAEPTPEPTPPVVTPPSTPKPESLKTVAVKTETPKREKAKTKKPSRKLEKPKKLKAANTQANDKIYTENLEEMSDSANATTIAAKTDKALTETGVPATAGEDTVMTIANAQYSKDQLDHCSKRCLIKSTDPKGQIINAVISGPAFAEVLRDHNGTINITGVKRVIKDQEIFLVQNITFNLPPRPQTAQATQIKNAPVRTNEPAWEDLSEDVKIR